MPASRFSSPQAAASHALAALERYQAHVRKLAANRTDMELYRLVGETLDEARHGCREVPELAHPWVELLIAHAELVQSIWQSSRPDAPDMAAQQRQLLDKIGGSTLLLQEACMRVLQARRPFTH